jgi:putative phosphoesterase
MRVAIIADVHGNLPALEAVLAELDREDFDLVVAGGDLFWGPWPAETLAAVRGLGSKALFVLGNCDRETVAADPADPHAATNAWVEGKLTAEDKQFVATWPLTLEVMIDSVGEVSFCHATPRSDTEIVTPLTPGDELAEALGSARAGLVVGGHTHVQFELVAGGKRFVNAGSVGWGYEGKPGAYWLELGPELRHRRTEYDFEAAAAALIETGWPGPLEAADILSPPGSEEALAVQEARRRPAPRGGGPAS